MSCAVWVAPRLPCRVVYTDDAFESNDRENMSKFIAGEQAVGGGEREARDVNERGRWAMYRTLASDRMRAVRRTTRRRGGEK